MKKIQSLYLFTAIVLFISCNSEDKLKEKNSNSSVEQQVKPETDKSPTEPTGEAMTIAQAKEFLDADSGKNKGKKVKVSAFPKGTTKPKNGEFSLYLCDDGGTGLCKVNFMAIFKEDATDKVKLLKSNNKVSVTGFISYGNNVIKLKDAAIAE
jgi:hypothetical protein